VPGVLAASLFLGLLGTMFVLPGKSPAPPPGGCQFAGQLVPAESQPGPDTGGLPIEGLAPLATEHSWRFGFGLSTPADPGEWALALGAGWYLDWAAAAPVGDLQVEHWPMVRVAPDCKRPTPRQAAVLARQRPGQTWIIGNEPDVIWQDNLSPEAYAAAYHTYYTAIKRADAKSRLAVAGVAQSTPLRLAYLDRVLEAYERAYGQPMPVYVWTVHNFVLREERGSWGVGIPPGFAEVTLGRPYDIPDHARVDLFEAQLRTFRSWMAQHGYRDTPLALTEFGILMPAEYGFPDEVVTDYLQATFDLLMRLADPASGYPADGNRLVQRWAWFSLSDPLLPTSDLADLPYGRLTDVGRAYRSTVERLGDGP
jgi:hypothetical protein